MDKLEERLDFNFSYKDCDTIDSLIKDYIADREELYKEIFCSNNSYTIEDIKDYITYFCSPASGDEEQDKNIHPYLYRLQHFLSRNYEIYLIPQIKELVDSILCLICTDLDIENIGNEITDTFEEDEFNVIQTIKNNWAEFLNKVASYPLLNLDKMEYMDIGGVQVYYNKTTEKYVLNTFKDFLETIEKDYPNTLLRMDTFVLTSPDYIHFCANDKYTQAFFTDDAIFYADKYEKQDTEDSHFYKQCLFHEFGHFIFSLLSETYQNYWYDCYNEWLEKGVSLSRDDDNKQASFCEELFADTFSTIYVDSTKDDYIHKPSDIVTDTLKFILEHEFNIKE